MKFNPEKPVKTRDGRKAEIVVSNLNNNSFPILAIVTERDGSQWGGAFDRQGRSSGVAHGGSINDLVNESERTALWGNVYPGSVVTHETYFDANANAYAGRIGLIYMTIEDGRLVAVKIHDTKGAGK